MGVDPLSLAIGATVLGAGSKIAGGIASKKAAKAQGTAEYQEALQEARNIRRQAGEVRSAARAGYSASGVMTDEGTPAAVDADIARRGEEDALNTILTGARRKSTLKKQGNAAMLGGFLDAGSTALSFGANVANGGWKK